MISQFLHPLPLFFLNNRRMCILKYNLIFFRVVPLFLIFVGLAEGLEVEGVPQIFWLR